MSGKIFINYRRDDVRRQLDACMTTFQRTFQQIIFEKTAAEQHECEEKGRLEAQGRQRKEKEGPQVERPTAKAEERLERFSQLKQEIERQEHESHSLSPRPTSSGKAKLRRTTPLTRVIVLAAAGIAMNTLGVLYDNGKGVAEDYGKVREWSQNAADAGNTNAMNTLGVLYDNGKGVAQDYGEAREWYEKAADAGNADAMNNFGVLYANGKGVAQDYDKAREWYKKAADAGQAGAMNNFGVLYANGKD